MAAEVTGDTFYYCHFCHRHVFNKPFGRGGVGVEVLEVFWEELWLHFFWPTFWLHCILYRTYTGGEAPPISKIQNAM